MPEATPTGRKPGRNAPCPCGSGQKYKFCCVAREARQRVVDTGPGGPVDLTHDPFNRFASADIPLKNFCQDQGFYYFGFLPVAEHLALLDALAAGTLTRDRIMALYRRHVPGAAALGLLAEAAGWCPHFAKRAVFIRDAVGAHFSAQYTLSVPALFVQIEGLLRDVGALPGAAKFKSTIPGEIWNPRLMFWVSDNAEYFNAFVNRLFEGQQGADAFGRNSVLHGANMQYGEDESLLLVLTLLEIRQFLWLSARTRPIVSGAVDRPRR